MKNHTLLFCLIASIGMCSAQDKASDFTGRNTDQPRDPRADQMNFVPNEVIVKFKDDVPLSSGARLRVAGVSAIDKVLKANGVDTLIRLFPGVNGGLLRSANAPRIVKDPQGRDMKIPNLDKIYKMTVPQLRSSGGVPTNIFQFIEELKALPEVEYAEPNYIYSVDDLQPVGPVLTADDVKKMQSTLRSSQSAVVPNDPLYNQQWYIPAVKADLVWEQTTGDTTQVIGILDTGVDWNHPDLKNKIWTNKDEIPDNGIDDDGNGLIDDVRGWDYINNDNNPMDDNSHGTHVAGIAAAETNNGIGIAGICPKAKIMPIKVFTSKGVGDAATIVKGINYAATHGATVINMSFGSYARSFTMENALASAYASAMLVAAAGNDKIDINAVDALGFSLAFFPAALSYVFGVQSDGDYSNYDPDGPVYSELPEGMNYELKAPGSALSTIPNGNYRILSGTSMATPIISGAIALYRSTFPEKSLEELWSDFIHSSDETIDLSNAFFNISKSPQLDLMSFSIKDNNEGCDNDGKADAGEIVDVITRIRNTGSPAGAVYAKIKQIDGDPHDITIQKDSVYFGSIGIYRSLNNDSMPFKVQINKDCFNNRNITLEVSMYSNPASPISTQKINFKIYNGEELSGILLRDTTLTPDKNWVISNSLRISQGVTLTILPGTSVEVLAGVDNRGFVNALGRSDNKINFKGIIGGNSTYKYTNIDMNWGSLESGNFDQCDISNVYSVSLNSLRYSKITNIGKISSTSGFRCDSVYRSFIENVFTTDGGIVGNFEESVIDNFVFPWWANHLWSIKYCVFDNMENLMVALGYKDTDLAYLYEFNGNNDSNVIKNTFLYNGAHSCFIKSSGSSDYVTLANQYWGTTNNNKISKKYVDFTSNASLPYLIYEPKLSTPSDSCPGHVWKVLVNGKDAQDEVVDPVGVGKQRFDVYFNRAMDKSITPKISFGGIYPYTSNPINEDAIWSEDGKIYTVYKTIKLTTGDGSNRIRVAGAKQSGDWGWNIPVEDQRFNFVISAANSASLEFMATPGLGKVKLEWNNNDLEDGLGYNMYRMEQINDSTLTIPAIVNTSLITDTLYTDYSVTPNKKYYYFYKIVRTDLSETDLSKVVSAIPFTASKGDANGDLSVNVLDITSIVAYLLNNNPQPFITEAADLNSDNSINVLDIVGVVNLVLYGNLRSATISQDQQASLYLENDTLFANTSAAIGGLQLDLSGVSSINDVQVLTALQGFESGYSQRGIDSLRLIYYSMSGKTIPVGNRIPLLKLKKGSQIVEAIVSDNVGAAIPLSLTAPSIGNTNDQKITVAELGQNYPNPSNGQTILPVQLFENVDEAVIRIFNVFGQEVKVLKLSDLTIGKHDLLWNSGNQKGLFVYKLELRCGDKQYVCPVRKMIVL